jgi:glycosyltransferase involved in cell wall biosynthesis
MTYNQGEYLHTAVQRALSQTYKNIEILISNFKE